MAERVAERIAVHATHEAAEQLGGIGTVLRGLLAEPAYQAAFPRSLLVGAWPIPDTGDPLGDRQRLVQAGWQVSCDSADPATQATALAEDLTAIAERHGVRLIQGERELQPGVRVPAVVVRPDGVHRAGAEAFVGRVRAELGLDLGPYLRWPAVTDGRDHRLERLLAPPEQVAQVPPDEPPLPVTDADGRPLPGGVGWVAQRAAFPPVPALDAFAGYGRANKFLLELQFHLYAAPALWAAARRLLDPDGQEPVDELLARTTLFAHDWLGVPLLWAAWLAGDRPAQTAYFAHEARLFRLLAEGVLTDWAPVVSPVCHLEGHDAALYPALAAALAAGDDLEAMFPGSGGFDSLYAHRLNLEARRFDRVLAVGPLVRDEMRLLVRRTEQPEPPVALCPNGLPAPRLTFEQVAAGRDRLATMIEHNLGFRPDVVLTAVSRCELSKAPWRTLALFERFVERFGDVRAVLLWLSSPKPRPTREQVARWAADYRWPLAHRGGAAGDLRFDEAPLGQAADAFNQRHAGCHGLLYINQFGWSREALGALDPLDSTFGDLRTATDVELGLSVYEPFGIAPLEPFAAGAVCVLSDACGSARHLDELGLAGRIVIGRFTEHDHDPATLDRAALRALEADVYETMLNALDTRLGLSGPAPSRAARMAGHRRERLAEAQRLSEHLSWAAAVAQGLLPALAQASDGR